MNNKNDEHRKTAFVENIMTYFEERLIINRRRKRTK